MQDNTITLRVEPDGVHGTDGANAEDREYARHEESAHSTKYIRTATHTRESRDTLQLYRTYAKRNGESRGSDKCKMKFTVDREVPNASGTGTIVLPHIVEINISTPLGVSNADTLDLRETAASLLRDADVSGSLNDLSEI